nr:FAD-dependent oxidoreductase [Angustibacter aerolatus]
MGRLAAYVRDKRIPLEPVPLVERADRCGAVGRGAPDRAAAPARVPRHRQHRQPADERHVDEPRDAACWSTSRLDARRPALGDGQRHEERVHRLRRAAGAHRGRREAGLPRARRLVVEQVDVAVVGAGPAGVAAAAAARQAGASVVLLDRHAFPRDKSCGDGIAAEGLDQARGARGRRPGRDGRIPRAAPHPAHLARWLGGRRPHAPVGARDPARGARRPAGGGGGAAGRRACGSTGCARSWRTPTA